MFNSSILDMTIGLVLIFLLYSLLATTINEGIATLLGLRARMLRNAISDHMLADTPNDSRWQSIWKGVGEFFTEIGAILFGRRKKSKEKIGEQFYNHPLIKNYGATRIFPLPSYITSGNFSTVLIDLLRKDFDQKLPLIVQDKMDHTDVQGTKESIQEELSLSTDLVKVKELLFYYKNNYAQLQQTPGIVLLDQDTWQILLVHLKQSGYQWDRFIQKLETWFDDTMKRVSGWYKRQTQTILFFLGLFIACLLNVDTIQIANRLSIDKAAREQLTQLAIQSIETYKDDPRIKRGSSSSSSDTARSILSEDVAYADYQRKLDSLLQQGRADLDAANNLLALGWNKKSGSVPAVFTWYDGVSKVIGFLLTALAICLGAPFWFDLLNKLVKFRGTGAKENGSPGSMGGSSSVAAAPVIIQSKTGEAAVG
jgi:hypothetical protein